MTEDYRLLLLAFIEWHCSHMPPFTLMSPISHLRAPFEHANGRWNGEEELKSMTSYWKLFQIKRSCNIGTSQEAVCPLAFTEWHCSHVSILYVGKVAIAIGRDHTWTKGWKQRHPLVRRVLLGAGPLSCFQWANVANGNPANRNSQLREMMEERNEWHNKMERSTP